MLRGDLMTKFIIKCKDNHSHKIEGRTYTEGRYCKQCVIWVPMDMIRCVCCKCSTRGRSPKTKYNHKTMKYEWM